MTPETLRYLMLRPPVRADETVVVVGDFIFVFIRLVTKVGVQGWPRPKACFCVLCKLHGLEGLLVQSLTEVAMEPPTQFNPSRGRGRPATARA